MIFAVTLPLNIPLPEFHIVGHLRKLHTHSLGAKSDGCESCVLCQIDRENGMSWGREKSSLNETCSVAQEAIYSPAQTSFLLVLASLTLSLIPSP